MADNPFGSDLANALSGLSPDLSNVTPEQRDELTKRGNALLAASISGQGVNQTRGSWLTPLINAISGSAYTNAAQNAYAAQAQKSQGALDRGIQNYIHQNQGQNQTALSQQPSITSQAAPTAVPAVATAPTAPVTSGSISAPTSVAANTVSSPAALGGPTAQPTRPATPPVAGTPIVANLPSTSQPMGTMAQAVPQQSNVPAPTSFNGIPMPVTNSFTPESLHLIMSSNQIPLDKKLELAKMLHDQAQPVGIANGGNMTYVSPISGEISHVKGAPLQGAVTPGSAPVGIERTPTGGLAIGGGGLEAAGNAMKATAEMGANAQSAGSLIETQAKGENDRRTDIIKQGNVARSMLPSLNVMATTSNIPIEENSLRGVEAPKVAEYLKTLDSVMPSLNLKNYFNLKEGTISANDLNSAIAGKISADLAHSYGAANLGQHDIQSAINSLGAGLTQSVDGQKLIQQYLAQKAQRDMDLQNIEHVTPRGQLSQAEDQYNATHPYNLTYKGVPLDQYVQQQKEQKARAGVSGPATGPKQVEPKAQGQLMPDGRTKFVVNGVTIYQKPSQQ